MAKVFLLSTYKTDDTEPTVKDKVEAIAKYLNVRFEKEGDEWVAIRN